MAFVVIATTWWESQTSTQDTVRYVGPFADKESAEAYIASHPELTYDRVQAQEEDACIEKGEAHIEELVRP